MSADVRTVALQARKILRFSVLFAFCLAVHGERDVHFWIGGLDGDLESKREAAKELTKLGESALPALLSALDTPNDGLRWQIINVLGQIRAPAALERLVEVTLKYDEPHARWRGYWVISAVNDGRANQLLASGLRDTDPAVRWRAAVGLSFLGDGSALPLLEEYLQHPDGWRRWEALNGLAQIKAASSWQRVASLALSDPSPMVRQEAVMTLWKLAVEPSLDVLARCAKDVEPHVRWRALCAIAAISPQRRDWSSETAAEDPSPIVPPAVSECISALISRKPGPRAARTF